jgi:hypothetical protein
VLYGERSARFDRWTLKHPWRAAVLGAGLPMTLIWSIICSVAVLGTFRGNLGLGSAVLAAVVGVVEVTVVVLATWRYYSQPSNHSGLWRWEESGQH